MKIFTCCCCGSSWKESLYESLGLTGYSDYTDTQHEKPLDKNRKIHDFQPSEYWDYSKSGDENADIYLKKCREDGRIPKFPKFAGKPGYWKLLIDFKMYDNDGAGSPQTVVKPEFDMDSAMDIMEEYKGGHQRLPVAQDVVDDFVAEYKGEKDVKTRFALSGKKVDNEGDSGYNEEHKIYDTISSSQKNVEFLIRVVILLKFLLAIILFYHIQFPRNIFMQIDVIPA